MDGEPTRSGTEDEPRGGGGGGSSGDEGSTEDKKRRAQARLEQVRLYDSSAPVPVATGPSLRVFEAYGSPAAHR